MLQTAHTASTPSGAAKITYSRSFAASLGIHLAVCALVIFGPYLLPRRNIQIGTGLGGGTGGDITTVGVVDELSGGAGMVKPSLVPVPPALKEKPKENLSKAIPLPDTLNRKIRKVPQQKKSAKPETESNRVPTPAEAGSGGAGGSSGGSGGGAGGGIGVSIGSGSGGAEGHWYARTVETRISDSWVRPPEGTRVDAIYRFYIDAYGRIRGIQKEKSSGNPELDFMAERAIRTAKNIPPPPPELQGRLIQFYVHFVYPPGQ